MSGCSDKIIPIKATCDAVPGKIRRIDLSNIETVKCLQCDTLFAVGAEIPCCPTCGLINAYSPFKLK